MEEVVYFGVMFHSVFEKQKFSSVSHKTDLRSTERKVFTVNNFELSAYLNFSTNRLAQAFLMEKHTSV